MTTVSAFSPDNLFDIVVRHSLHFDQSRQTGVVFHMLSSLAEKGRSGATAVGDSPALSRGFANLPVHDLKHGFGRRLRSAGAPLKTQKALLGHKNGDIKSAP